MKKENIGRHINLSLKSNAQYNIQPKIIDFILAAGMVPTIYPPVAIFGHKFVEGGIRDITPLQTAINAFELVKAQGYTEAEFILVNNYVAELPFEAAKYLDSGIEILGRGIKIMTIEMAKNDLILGRKRLEEIKDVQTVLKVIQPTLDPRLAPMNFGDMDKRMVLRRHGQAIATEILS